MTIQVLGSGGFASCLGSLCPFYLWVLGAKLSLFSRDSVFLGSGGYSTGSRTSSTSNGRRLQKNWFWGSYHDHGEGYTYVGPTPTARLGSGAHFFAARLGSGGMFWLWVLGF
jgi:hypothetical protein